MKRPLTIITDWYCFSVNDCPMAMSYTACGDPCPETCADQGNRRNCSLDDCIKTCVCPVGQVLDGLECVPSQECGCILSDGQYIPVRTFSLLNAPVSQTLLSLKCFCLPNASYYTTVFSSSSNLGEVSVYLCRCICAGGVFPEVIARG